MFDDFIHMIPRAFGYTMAKSFYTYIDTNKVKDNKEKKEKEISEELSEKKEEVSDKNEKNDKNVNLVITKGF